MASAPVKIDFIKQSGEFLRWLGEWHTSLQPLALDSAISDPTRTAVCLVDMLNGFCHKGALASPRAAACTNPIVELFTNAHVRGVRHFVSVQEWHSRDAEEFRAFPAHCIGGTHEAELVHEIAALPFARDFYVARKNSLHAIVGTTLEQWLKQRPHLNTFIIAGVCTDLCTYDIAIDLKLRANSRDVPCRVIVPANVVNTYDLPVETARQIGALPHDGDLLHAMFLYMMALNNIEVVKELV